MSVDYGAIQARLLSGIYDNWAEHVEIGGEPRTIPSKGTNTYLKVYVMDLEARRDGFGDVTEANGNLVIRLFGSDDDGAKKIHTRSKDLENFLDDLNKKLELGVQFGESMLTHVVPDPQKSLLVSVYTRPFRTI